MTGGEAAIRTDKALEHYHAKTLKAVQDAAKDGLAVSKRMTRAQLKKAADPITMVNLKYLQSGLQLVGGSCCAELVCQS